MPFIPFEKQSRYIAWLLARLETQTPGVVVKPRDIGITYLNCAYSCWALLFKRDVKIGFSSRKLKLVDESSNNDSIFYKLRQILKRLPGWMRGQIDDRIARLSNPITGSSVVGEGGDNIGRGGRSTIYFADEFAFMEQQESADAALSQTSNVVIYCSTYSAPGNTFYQKARGSIPLYQFQWQDDPRKSPEWYQEQVNKYDPIIIAREIDCDPLASMEGTLIKPEWVKAATAIWGNPNLRGIAGEVVVGYDPAASENGCESVAVVRQGIKALVIDSWKGDDIERNTGRVIDLGKAHHADKILYDGDGLGIASKQEFRKRGVTYAYPIMGAGNGDDRFLNRRALLYWQLRERIRRTWEASQGSTEHDPLEYIAIPDDGLMVEQLLGIRIAESATDKIKIESKDDMRRRGLQSPDRADALAYAFYSGRHGIKMPR